MRHSPCAYPVPAIQCLLDLACLGLFYVPMFSYCNGLLKIIFHFLGLVTVKIFVLISASPDPKVQFSILPNAPGPLVKCSATNRESVFLTSYRLDRLVQGTNLIGKLLATLKYIFLFFNKKKQ